MEVFAIRTIVLAAIVLATITGIFAWLQGAASASTLLPLPQAVLESKAITAAQEAGLQGAPTAKNVTRMTFGEWLKMTDAELGKDAAKFGLSPDIPVFVLAMRGNVESRLAGLPQPGQTEQAKFDNITIVLNARNGELLWMGAVNQGFPMLVPVP
jgi:hypothetical protein